MTFIVQINVVDQVLEGKSHSYRQCHTVARGTAVGASWAAGERKIQISWRETRLEARQGTRELSSGTQHSSSLLGFCPQQVPVKLKISEMHLIPLVCQTVLPRLLEPGSKHLHEQLAHCGGEQSNAKPIFIIECLLSRVV